MSAYPGFHCWRHSQRLMHTAEVVVPKLCTPEKVMRLLAARARPRALIQSWSFVVQELLQSDCSNLV